MKTPLLTAMLATTTILSPTLIVDPAEQLSVTVAADDMAAPL